MIAHTNVGNFKKLVISKFQKSMMNIIKKNKATEENESLGEAFGLGL